MFRIILEPKPKSFIKLSNNLNLLEYRIPILQFSSHSINYEAIANKMNG